MTERVNSNKVLTDYCTLGLPVQRLFDLDLPTFQFGPNQSEGVKGALNHSLDQRSKMLSDQKRRPGEKCSTIARFIPECGGRLSDQVLKACI